MGDQTIMAHITRKSSNALGRRDFMRLSALSAGGAALSGCVTNPVTGRSQLILMSEQQEVQVDKQHGPHQLSADYGAVQDARLNAYVESVGKALVAHAHRPRVPYSFRVVNANYVNAYAFPGGTIATTRGIMLGLENEAELAGLLGHELGHVNARHTARQMTKGTLSGLVLAGISYTADQKGGALGQVAAGLGQLGAGALLATYSRANEREADDLGLIYMVKAGYSPEGFVGLMDLLQSLSKHKPSAIELMFSTHPMSTERYQTALREARSTYAAHANGQLGKERYMDNTASLRRIKRAIETMQDAERALGKKQYGQAEGMLEQALRLAPNDYVAHVLMAKCQLLKNTPREAVLFADRAKAIYPQEAQAYHIAGLAKIRSGQYEAAYNDFVTYDRVLAGNVNTVFYKGRALEGMGRRDAAAQQYMKYLKAVNQGENAKYAYRRLVEWGYIKES